MNKKQLEMMEVLPDAILNRVQLTAPVEPVFLLELVDALVTNYVWLKGFITCSLLVSDMPTEFIVDKATGSVICRVDTGEKYQQIFKSKLTLLF